MKSIFRGIHRIPFQSVKYGASIACLSQSDGEGERDSREIECRLARGLVVSEMRLGFMVA